MNFFETLLSIVAPTIISATKEEITLILALVGKIGDQAYNTGIALLSGAESLSDLSSEERATVDEFHVFLDEILSDAKVDAQVLPSEILSALKANIFGLFSHLIP